MSSSDSQSYTSPISKVTLTPVKDSTRNTDALIVTIKRVDNPKPEDIPQYIRFPDYGKVNRNRHKLRRSHSSSTESRTRNKTNMSLAKDNTMPNTSETGKGQNEDNTFCARHAALKLSKKKSKLSSEKLSLCNSCSKSMLSYIFLVQDFLDGLAKEISGEAVSNQCFECMKENITGASKSQCTDTIGQSLLKVDSSESKEYSKDSSKSKEYSEDRNKSKEYSEDSSKYKVYSDNEENKKESVKRSTSEKIAHKESKRTDQEAHLTTESKSRTSHFQDVDASSLPNALSSTALEKQSTDQLNIDGKDLLNKRNAVASAQMPNLSPLPDIDSEECQNVEMKQITERDTYSVQTGKCEQLNKEIRSGQEQRPNPSSHVGIDDMLRPSLERQQPNFNEYYQENQHSESYSDKDNYKNVKNPPSLFDENIDGIMSTLSNEEREVYDSARDRAGWERPTELHEGQGSSLSEGQMSEAFVTMARNNAEALGSLVLGTSLVLCGTSRSLCVLVSDGVSAAFRGLLSSVFHVIQYVRSLDALGTTKLGLLQQPELGISFDKLNVWRLLQFNKCVYLNPDTLVIQNCDELFSYEEISAVPDIGWPDCFNSGVFVFVPSMHTFWKLLEFAENQGSYDGGDQGLLNSYFSSWSRDIHKKLSFIYNLMANVSYTYTPAFKQFGRNVKIVQFLGSFKPWHVKFYSSTAQIAPTNTVHPTYVQFVLVWLHMFRIKILHLFPEEAQSYLSSNKIISAFELLRFFPAASESEIEFLSPPSVRLHLKERYDQLSNQLSKIDIQKIKSPAKSSNAERKRRQSAEFSSSNTNLEQRQRRLSTDNISLTTSPINRHEQVLDVKSNNPNDEKSINPDENILEEFKPKSATKSNADTQSPATEETLDSQVVCQTENVSDKNKNLLPGSEVGDYQGMRAWEQGRMDYQGSDSSENIIKRLEFLMSQNE